MLAPVTQLQITLFFLSFAAQARFTIASYLFVKGFRWGMRNTLSAILVITLMFCCINSGFTTFFVSKLSWNCATHLTIMDTSRVLWITMIDCVVYYRAWAIAGSKNNYQKYLSIFMIVGHFAFVVNDAVTNVQTISDRLGFCTIQLSWPRMAFGVFSMINDLLQLVFFCIPLLNAVKQSVSIRSDASAFRRMILKSVICFTFSSLLSIAYIIMVYFENSAVSVICLELAFIFQILGTCEIQFNSHRETDKQDIRRRPQRPARSASRQFSEGSFNKSLTVVVNK
ncbi:hypothetical protein EDD86DRAFT_230802 [Gorgonomyces haynaldii]|nr:hypothetical protein EDD86DRAFT_230802 [Gorgonomyces haynaldii]